MELPKKRTVLFLAAIYLFTTGCIDLDWMVVAPRFNRWYYTVDYWEFCPFLKMNWWLAYAVTLLRVIIGSLMLGWLILPTTMGRSSEKP